MTESLKYQVPTTKWYSKSLPFIHLTQASLSQQNLNPDFQRELETKDLEHTDTKDEAPEVDGEITQEKKTYREDKGNEENIWAPSKSKEEGSRRLAGEARMKY